MKLVTVAAKLSRIRWLKPLVGLIYFFALYIGFKLAARPELHWSVPLIVMALPLILMLGGIALMARLMPKPD